MVSIESRAMNHHLEAGIRDLVNEFQASGRPCPAKQSIADRRAGYVGSVVLAGQSPSVASEFTDVLHGIPVKVYKPTHEEALPITVYFHGGCFVSGGFDTHDVQLRQMALQSHSIVICLQYRLAPEHCYPAAHDDVYQAVLGIKEYGGNYGGDSERLVFVGDSAGGQLALATTLRLKKSQQWLPCRQILIYPMLDPYGQSQSYVDYGSDYVITADMLLSGFDLYTNSDAKVLAHPELNLLKCDFKGLPTTTIVTAEFDPLRDEGEKLYQLMISQGVQATCQRFLGVIHGFFQLAGVSEAAKQCMALVSSQIHSVRRIR